MQIGLFLNEQIFTVISAVPSSEFPLTAVQTSGTVLTITAVNNLVPGQLVSFSGLTDPATIWLNGLTLLVASASASQFTIASTHGAGGPTSDWGMVIATGNYTASDTVDATVTPKQPDSGSASPLISTITGSGTTSPLCNSVAPI